MNRGMKKLFLGAGIFLITFLLAGCAAGSKEKGIFGLGSRDGETLRILSGSENQESEWNSF